MKIKCTWVFLQKVQGIQTPQMKAKAKYVENESPEKVMNMIETLLAQSETVRLIFEVDK